MSNDIAPRLLIRHNTTTVRGFLGAMFTAQQIIIGGGLSVLAWAVIHGLMCHGGHRKSLHGTKKR